MMRSGRICLLLAGVVLGVVWIGGPEPPVATAQDTDLAPPVPVNPIILRGVQCGVGTTGPDGTVKITFDPAFSAPPVVTLTPISADAAGGCVFMTVVSVTASQFTARASILLPEHTHPIALEPPHGHTVFVDPSGDHTHGYNEVSIIRSVPGHTHGYDRAIGVTGTTPGPGGGGVAAGPYDVKTSYTQEGCAPVDAWRAITEGFTITEWPVCFHSHLVTIDQVIDHGHVLAHEKVDSQAGGNHTHLFEVVQSPTKPDGVHSHLAVAAPLGAHDHTGVTGLGGTTVCALVEGVQFAWIACAQ